MFFRLFCPVNVKTFSGVAIDFRWRIWIAVLKRLRTTGLYWLLLTTTREIIFFQNNVSSCCILLYDDKIVFCGFKKKKIKYHINTLIAVVASKYFKSENKKHFSIFLRGKMYEQYILKLYWLFPQHAGIWTATAYENRFPVVPSPPYQLVLHYVLVPTTRIVYTTHTLYAFIYNYIYRQIIIQSRLLCTFYF